jgi:hypothetical protein
MSKPLGLPIADWGFLMIEVPKRPGQDPVSNRKSKRFRHFPQDRLYQEWQRHAPAS